MVKSKEKTSEPDHLETAVSLTNLALAYQGVGEYDKALPLYNRALKIREKALGPEHLDTIAGLNNLATLYLDMGAFGKSLPLYERILKIREKNPGPDHPDTAVSLNNLALAYQGLGDYDKALPLYERSLKIKKQSRSRKIPALPVPWSIWPPCIRPWEPLRRPNLSMRELLRSEKRHAWTCGEQPPAWPYLLQVLFGMTLITAVPWR